jgi:hypothetical protein
VGVPAERRFEPDPVALAAQLAQLALVLALQGVLGGERGAEQGQRLVTELGP